MLSDSSIKKILKKAGALRAGKSVVKKLNSLAEEFTIVLARKAVKNAEYSGRKSVRVEDIDEALEKENSFER